MAGVFSVTTNGLVVRRGHAELVERARRSRHPRGRLLAREGEEVRGTGDLGHDVAVRRRGPRVDGALQLYTKSPATIGSPLLYLASFRWKVRVLASAETSGSDSASAGTILRSLSK